MGAVTVVDMESTHKGEAALPTGVSAEPGVEAGGKKARARAKGPAAAKGKTSAAKGGKAATAAKAGKTASSTREQTKRPGSRSAAAQRKSPRRGR